MHFNQNLLKIGAHDAIMLMVAPVGFSGVKAQNSAERKLATDKVKERKISRLSKPINDVSQ